MIPYWPLMFVIQPEPAPDYDLMAKLVGAGPAGQCRRGNGSKRSRETSPRYRRTRTGNTQLKRPKKHR